MIRVQLMLSWGGTRYPWNSAPVLGVMVAAVVAIALLTWRLRTAAEPLIPLRLLSNKVVLTGGTAVGLCMGVFVGLSIYVPIYFETIMGLSATQSGLALLPLMTGSTLGAVVCGKLMTRMQHYKIAPMIGLTLGGRVIDVRVSTLPSAHGERAVLRLLDKSESRLTLEAVGMQGQVLQHIEQLVAQPHGIILVTGPTGSGKTTTLYAALQRLDAHRQNIMTVEDPIEYELPGVGQTQVNAKIDLSFAKALRAILRQDPDVIMIGEIRDFETAQIAIQASLTGHLVLATLHTNDAASAVTRLTDMGIEPFLLSSSLLGVLAQRLVRKLCTHCQGQGCEHCAQTGYAGRTGIFELLVTNDAIRAQIHAQAAEADIRAAALAGGMVLMREDGQRLVDQGITSAQELVRITRD